MKFKLLKESAERREQILSQSILCEDMLKEDKVVKFGGEVHPNFGWCVILAGGAGSGKSTAYKHLIPINAKTYNVDDIKDFLLGAKDTDFTKYKVVRSELNGDKIVLRNGQEISLDGVPEPYNLSNSEFTNRIHTELRPISKKVKKNFLDMGKNASPDRLPNIAFDITGKDIDDIEEIVYAVKPLGYKVALIWILADIEQAISQNEKRFRQVRRDILVQTHKGVIYSLYEIATRTGLYNDIDEFYVIMQIVFNIKDPKELDKYINIPNVYKIETKDDITNFPDVIKDTIENNMKLIITKYLKNDENIVDKTENM